MSPGAQASCLPQLFQLATSLIAGLCLEQEQIERRVNPLIDYLRIWKVRQAGMPAHQSLTRLN